MLAASELAWVWWKRSVLLHIAGISSWFMRSYCGLQPKSFSWSDEQKLVGAVVGGVTYRFSRDSMRKCFSLPDRFLVDGGDTGRSGLFTISAHFLGHSSATLSSTCLTL